jgi:hypothetical protein
MKALLNHTTKRRFGILCVGDPSVDEVFSVPLIPAPAEKIVSTRVRRYPGGATADVACAASRLGHLDLNGFARRHINHGRMGSISEAVRKCAAFGARNGVRPALQCQGPFPALQGVDWLFDSSFGTGKHADRWPSLTSEIALRVLGWIRAG